MNTRQLYNRLQRFRLPMGSLRAQLAVASAVVALAAVLMVTLAAALSLSISFGQYRRNQLSSEVHQLASLIERRASEMNTSASAELSASILLIRPTRSGQFQQENLWTMDQQGNVLYSPPIGHRSGQVSPSDAREVATALYAALGGHSSEGSLPYTAIPWLSQRYFAAAPIQLGSSPGAPIIGSVALSSLPRADLGVAFFSNIRTTLFLTGLATALLAALGATVFSRRLTSPSGASGGGYRAYDRRRL